MLFERILSLSVISLYVTINIGSISFIKRSIIKTRIQNSIEVEIERSCLHRFLGFRLGHCGEDFSTALADMPRS